MSNTLATRFPTPSLAPAKLSPPRLPGISPQSTEALKEVLKDNHQRWHVFFNDLGFHNHAAHRAIALWAIGAPGDVINAGYQKDLTYEKPAIQSPAPITDENFDEHLGDDKYYSGYVEFFAEYIEKNGMGKAMEDWVYSARANLGKGFANLPKDQQPRMLARFISGVIHPLIHTGYGAEFGLPGMMAEGLAQCAVHSAATSALVAPTLFDGTLFKEAPKETKGLTVFDVLGQVHDELYSKSPEATKVRDFDAGLGQHASTLLRHASKWELDINKLGQDEYLSAKIEELVLLVVSLYGVSGWTSRGTDQEFRADFFLMHLVTSSVFLPSHAALVPPEARAKLLHTYFMTALSLYAFVSCPTLDFAGFYAHTGVPNKKGDTNTNPWLSLIQDAIDHHDEHLTKTQRALAAWSAHFGSKTFRLTAATSPALKGIELLDGNLFLKTAQLTTLRVGPPVNEPESAMLRARPTEWDFADLSED
ncbi:hypothetical protein BKA70DRAFT_1226035 [Coprinopsis sp. MPI-PUGE-AT-0042]|nr:hypothetical protein BKA70DRAFT_1226035 [Coprinopsis sp. MPI-PUGE-AT-0042]